MSRGRFGSRASRALALLGGCALLIATAGVGHATPYRVQSGDTLSGIAARNGVSVKALAAANGIANRNLVVAGTTLTVPAAAAPPAPRHHVVKAGENLTTIAKKYGLSVGALAAANGIVDRNHVEAGKRLTLASAAPAGSPTTAAPAEATTYKVRAGDTLLGIALRHGVSLSGLAAANDIANPSHIVVGQTLSLAGGAPPSAAAVHCPVAGPVRFVNDYAVPKLNEQGEVYRYHEGVDLYAPRGAAVVAPVSGTVRHLEGRIGGLQFYLSGDDNNLYFGSHMDSFGASGRVAAGTTIGTVGDSGNARGAPPHLHFQLHPGGGEPTNPYPFLVEVC